MPNKFVSALMKLVDADLEVPFARADLQILGLRHGSASFEGRIFLNNPDANASIEPSPNNGYAGCFFVFGHGGCFGDPGHCDITQRRPFDPRPPHPLTPLTKSITITGPLRERVRPGEEFTVTVIADPVPFEAPSDDRPYLREFEVDRENLLAFDELRLVTYD